MNEQSNDTNAAFMEVTLRKVEVYDKKIEALEEKLKSIPDNKDLIQKVTEVVEGLRDYINNSRFPHEKITAFTKQLDTNIKLLSQPMINKVVHHQHIPKLIWITAGLFITLSVACMSWYLTSNKLAGYIENDTKYRYLRLDTAQKSLQFYLYHIDSLYTTYPDLRKKMLQKEEQYRINFGRLQRAERLRAEAKDLEKSARKR